MAAEESESSLFTHERVRAGVVLGLVAVAVYLWHPELAEGEAELADPLFQPF